MSMVITEKKPGNLEFKGLVVSNKMDKTIVVRVERTVRHPVYDKVVKRYKKLHAHDENNACSIGDTVIVCQGRPRSKTKTWDLVEIVVKAKQE